MGVEEVPQSEKIADLNIKVLPNPFSKSTKISFQLTETAQVECAIYDITGREVQTLMSTSQGAGNYSLIWNSKDNNGNAVESGVYFVRVLIGQGAKQTKLIILK